MTLFHFGNCVALAYVPYFMTYKYSGLAEYGSFKRCIQAGGIYLATQLCKMLFLATFFPTNEFEMKAMGIDVVGEFLKCTVDLADVIGMHIVIVTVAGKGDMKFLVAGVGWATAELVMTRFLPLWFGARAVEFNWKYIQMSLDSNVRLVLHITMAMLIWLWGRHDLKSNVLALVVTMMGILIYKPLFLGVAAQVLAIKSWSVLGVDALVTMLVGLTSLQVYVSLISH